MAGVWLSNSNTNVHEMEPTVYLPTDEDTPRLAFTRYTRNPDGSFSSRIIAELASNRPESVASGHSPSWSRDGNQIAFVSPDGDISIYDVLKHKPRKVGAGKGRWPVWLPGDKRLLFAKSEKAGFSLYVVNEDGVGPQLKQIGDGSYYAFPAATGSSTTPILYFMSNRGAAKAGDEDAWGIYWKRKE